MGFQYFYIFQRGTFKWPLQPIHLISEIIKSRKVGPHVLLYDD